MRWTQLGVVSWGVNEQVNKVYPVTLAPDIFVRVSAFCSWMLGGQSVRLFVYNISYGCDAFKPCSLFTHLVRIIYTHA